MLSKIVEITTSGIQRRFNSMHLRLNFFFSFSTVAEQPSCEGSMINIEDHMEVRHQLSTRDIVSIQWLEISHIDSLLPKLCTDRCIRRCLLACLGSLVDMGGFEQNETVEHKFDIPTLSVMGDRSSLGILFPDAEH